MDKDKVVKSFNDPSVREIAGRSLRAVLSGKCGQGEVNELVGVCHALAIPYLRKRLNGDVILKKTLELDTRDFAFDCVADLFAYAESGEFPHFQAYFAAYPVERLTEEETLSHLRRLVFSHVNHGIFRLYNEVDPSLGKVIRNIKLALQQFHALILIERFGVPYLAPSEGDLMLQFRSLEPDEIESGLRSYLRGTENIPVMLGKLALFLQERPEVSRIVPLSLVGMVFRSIYMSRTENEEPAEIVEEKMEIDGLSEIIRSAVEETREKMAGQYLRKKRINPALLDTYFLVIERRLTLTFSGDGKEKGLRELLGERLDNMTNTEYRTRHRSRLEYLSRLTGEEVARRLKTG